MNNVNTLIDLTGQQFGSLTVIKKIPMGQKNHSHWICECACGNYPIVRSDNLRKGRSTKCSECRGDAGRQSRFERGYHDD